MEEFLESKGLSFILLEGVLSCFSVGMIRRTDLGVSFHLILWSVNRTRDFVVTDFFFFFFFFWLDLALFWVYKMCKFNAIKGSFHFLISSLFVSKMNFL